ncbi:reeler domain containing 1 [Epinephelus lanceolatus]
MQPTLQCFGVGVVLLSLAPPTMSFSRGASHVSCREMIPGHISAQPQDPQRSHVTLHTSASSYLPGQLVTVTVRSSRDFMGFLLQARSVEGAGVKARTGVGVGAGLRSTRVGPVLLGGSWTLTPPGTHTLRCLSEGDTLTHSDKQLKRNLSFVWKAPDAPMGDIKFYITVVQSYFVYWAGIDSAVVHDGSRSPWSGSNITKVDEENSDFVLQQDEALPALGSLRASIKKTIQKASPPTTLGPPTPTSSGTQDYKYQEKLTEVTRSILEMNTSGTFASDQEANEWNSPVTLGSLQNATKVSETDPYATSGSPSGVTEEAGADTGNPFTHTIAEATDMEAVTNLLPNITVQNSTSPLSLLQTLASLLPLKDGKMQRKEAKKNFQDPKLPTIPGTKDTTLNPETTTKAIPSPTHGFQNQNTLKPTSQHPRKLIQDQTSSVKSVTQSSSPQPWRTALTGSHLSLIKDEMGSQYLPQNLHLKLLLHYQMSSTNPFHQATSPSKPPLQSQSSTSQTSPLYQSFAAKLFSKIQTSSPNLIQPSEAPSHQSFPNKPVSSLSKPESENSQFGQKTRPGQTSPPPYQLHTTAPLSSPPHPKPLSSYPQALLQTIPTQPQEQASFLQMDQSQTWSKPHSQTVAPQAQSSGWKQMQSSATPGSINPLPFTSRVDLTLIPGDSAEVKDFQSQAKIETMSPIFASIPSTTPSPSFAVSDGLSRFNSLLHTFPASSFVHSTTPLYSSGGSTLVSIQTSVTHAPFSPSFFSSSMKNQAKTAPALSALPSPTPISIPPHLPSIQPSSTSPRPSSFNSSTKFSSNSNSNYPSPASFFSLVSLSTSSSTLMASSQSITSSTYLSPSSSTISPALSSSSSVSSISSPSIPPSPPPSSSYTSTSTSTSSSLDFTNPSATSSSMVSSQSTSPLPGPSPVPRRSLYNPLTSTSSPVPFQQLTPGQRLPVQNHITSSDPGPSLNLPTSRTVVHPNPEPHPNLDPNFKLNRGHELKPNLPNTDTNPKLKRPSNPPATPDKEGKYPDIIPRHSAWELGMLLGCSAGLGMVLVVGVRYMYRQACGKRTEVTLNDREREYGRGERGLIHVQECGDLVRVRRIRENSFVLLAEYDILASPGD